MKTLKRRDITLEEQQEVVDRGNPYLNEPLQAESYWTARISGQASTEEYVEMSRTAEHAGEALHALEEALKKEGYELR